MSWNLTAQMIETCSCNMLCPCWYGVQELMVMDQGWCAGPLMFRVQQGNSEGVDLGGSTVVVVPFFPGPTLFDGNGTARLYIDAAATGEQQRELKAIFQGRKGGPMEILGGLISQWLPTQVTEIDFREEGDKITAQVGDFGRVESQLLKSESGRTMLMKNVGFAEAFQFNDLTAELAPSASQWKDPELPRTFETKSGVRAVCNWNVN